MIEEKFDELARQHRVDKGNACSCTWPGDIKRSHTETCIALWDTSITRVSINQPYLNTKETENVLTQVLGVTCARIEHFLLTKPRNSGVPSTRVRLIKAHGPIITYLTYA